MSTCRSLGSMSSSSGKTPNRKNGNLLAPDRQFRQASKERSSLRPQRPTDDLVQRPSTWSHAKRITTFIFEGRIAAQVGTFVSVLD